MAAVEAAACLRAMRLVETAEVVAELGTLAVLLPLLRHCRLRRGRPPCSRSPPPVGTLEVCTTAEAAPADLRDTAEAEMRSSSCRRCRAEALRRHRAEFQRSSAVRLALVARGTLRSPRGAAEKAGATEEEEEVAQTARVRAPRRWAAAAMPSIGALHSSASRPFLLDRPTPSCKNVVAVPTFNADIPNIP